MTNTTVEFALAYAAQVEYVKRCRLQLNEALATMEAMLPMVKEHQAEELVLGKIGYIDFFHSLGYEITDVDLVNKAKEALA